MNGNALCAKLFAIYGKFDYIGDILATRIAQGGNLIYVYTESCHGLSANIQLKIRVDKS